MLSPFHTLTFMSALHVTSCDLPGTAASFSTDLVWAATARIGRPALLSVTFHLRSWLSAPTEKPALPSALTATPKTVFWWSGKVKSDSLAARSQTLAVLSSPPVNSSLPSSENATAETQSAWFSIAVGAGALSRPSDRSQTLTSRSDPPE